MYTGNVCAQEHLTGPDLVEVNQAYYVKSTTESLNCGEYAKARRVQTRTRMKRSGGIPARLSEFTRSSGATDVGTPTGCATMSHPSAVKAEAH